MKKKSGLVYFSTTRGHLCTPLGEGRYRDLTNGHEFTDADGAVRSVMPEDLLGSILIESDPSHQWHYIRLSYLLVEATHKVSNQVSVDLDKEGKVVGIRLNYPWQG